MAQLPPAPCRRTRRRAVYGPTTGPPPPGTPAGVTPAVEVSAMARARLTRPLPEFPPVVGSALRARRPTMVAGDALGSLARSSAAAPATTAAEAEVPVIEVTPPASDAAMSDAGRADEHGGALVAERSDRVAGRGRADADDLARDRPGTWRRCRRRCRRPRRRPRRATTRSRPRPGGPRSHPGSRTPSPRRWRRGRPRTRDLR